MDRPPEKTHGFVWHDDFVPMWQFAEPGIEVRNLGWAAGEHREIACMDQDVASRHIDLAMKLMRVAE
jgi:hypothetical protein